MQNENTQSPQQDQKVSGKKRAYIKKQMTQYPYIKKETEENIKNFKYKGGSVSITYQHIWSPLCQYLVELLPTSIAPNLITMTAFSFVVLSHCILVYYSPDFAQPIPTPALIFTGVTTLAYQILDNMDGKQARRTGSSTPLGMLFDHGLDSVTSWIFGINQIICFGAGINTLSMFTLLFSSYIGFYVAMWSQYHIGILELGKINAVDEGLILIWNLFFFTSYVGVEFWQQEAIYGYKINEIAVCLLLLICFRENMTFLYNTLSAKIHRDLKQKLKTLEQSFLLTITFITFIFFTPEELVQTRYSYLFFIEFGLLWSKSTFHLQIAHLGDNDNFNQWRISFLFACLSQIVNSTCGFLFGATLVCQKKLIIFTFVYGFLIFIHTSTNIAKQMARFLEINIFSLKYKKEQQQKQQKAN